jgi:hypothetical protein
MLSSPDDVRLKGQTGSVVLERSGQLLALLRHATGPDDVRSPGYTGSLRRTMKTTLLTRNGHSALDDDLARTYVAC